MQTPCDQESSENDDDMAARRVRHSTYIDEIEGLDDHCGQTLATVYERGEQETFAAQLAERVAQHDRAIERKCNYHYQGFIDSVRQLLEVRGEVAQLRTAVTSLDQRLEEAGQQLLARGRRLIRCRRTQVNTEAAAEALRSCLPLLATFSRLKKLIADGQLFGALRTIDQLRAQLRPEVRRFRVAETIAAQLPAISEGVRQTAMSDLTDFLEEARRQAPRMGRSALRDIMRDWQEYSPPHLPPDPGEDGDSHVDAIISDRECEEDEEGGSEGEGERGVSVDCAPLYRCWHVQRALGGGESFAEYYRRQRWEQARLECDARGSSELLHAVAGFLELEERVAMTTGDALISAGHLQRLWNELMVPTLVGNLQRRCELMERPRELKLLRRELLAFCQLMSSRRLPVQRLTALLSVLLNRYTSLLMERWRPVFDRLLSSDNFRPLELSTPSEFERVASVYSAVGGVPVEWWPAEGQSDWPFPRHLPFSLMVPRLLHHWHAFLVVFAACCRDLSTAAERDEAIRGAANALFLRCVGPALAEFTGSLGLLSLVQVTVNIDHLQRAAVQLASLTAHIAGLSSTVYGNVHTALSAHSVLTDIRCDTEQLIYSGLQRKIDEILELSAFDWQLLEPTGSASSSILDVLAFLRSTFDSFSQLPAAVARAACMSACQHMAGALQAPLTSPTVRHVSEGSLQQLSLDLLQCEQLAASEPVPGFEEGALLACFASLRQLLDLLLAWDWQVYVEQFGNVEARYSRVQPAVAALVVEKLRPNDRRHVFSVLKRADRDRRKMQDGLLRQLRQLEETHSTAGN